MCGNDHDRETAVNIHYILINMAAMITPEGQLGANPQTNMFLSMLKGAFTDTNLSETAKEDMLASIAGMLGVEKTSGRKRPPTAMTTGK